MSRIMNARTYFSPFAVVPYRRQARPTRLRGRITMWTQVRRELKHASSSPFTGVRDTYLHVLFLPWGDGLCERQPKPTNARSPMSRRAAQARQIEYRCTFTGETVDQWRARASPMEGRQAAASDLQVRAGLASHGIPWHNAPARSRSGMALWHTRSSGRRRQPESRPGC